jgi:small subunit ribosomal protein S2
MYSNNHNKGIPYNKKTFLMEHFFNYKTLIGNKLRFTNSESYEYIFSINFTGNTILNINKSLILLKRALIFIKQIKKNKGKILFVGTRYDLRKVIEEIGNKTESPYVNYRWSKGLLTNWENTNTSIKFYNLFLKKLDMRTKKRVKMENTFFGLTSMTRLPDAIFIFDISTDFEAFTEAKSLNIPVISLVDTNIPTRGIDYPIPSNTESLLSVIFFANLIISTLSNLSHKLKP